MTADQMTLFALFAVVLGMFLWGRVRYDIVAFSALLIGVVLGLVPVEQTFYGFGHQATLIVVMVLIVSAGLVRSGAVNWLARHVADKDRPVPLHIAILGGTGAVMSGFMNNIAALALLMPIDTQTARRARRAVGITLMPLSFACILGGMITMIGTPPNIIIATFRSDELGASFSMFDFTPVGGAVALAGLLFVALIGWRLLPERVRKVSSRSESLDEFIAELAVPAKSKLVGKRVREIEDKAEDKDVAILAVLREGKRRYGAARNLVIGEDDVLLVEASPEALEDFRTELKLEFPEADKTDSKSGKSDKNARKTQIDIATGAGMVLIEVVVQQGARIAGKTAQSVGLSWRHQAVLMGISREGRTIRDRIRRTVVQPGDILLLLVPEETQTHVTEWLGGISLAGREQPVFRPQKTAIAIGLFALAVLVASFEILPLTVALGFVVVGYVLTRVLPLDELYTNVDWPVVVLLGSMIPLGLALDRTGGAALIADALLNLTASMPAWVALALIMVITMTLSDILNNNATTILAAPVALRLAERMEVNPDAFLMAVAVAASCAFLTPIGHQNNTVILGPGGYRFSDYWRMGLPLEIIVVAVGVPMILLVWPL
jgi:di/tricarboxylate transporter